MGSKSIFIQNGNSILSRNDYIAIYLEKIDINPNLFWSKDFLDGSREGIVNFRVCGRDIAVPFSIDDGKSRIYSKFLNKLIYLGRNPVDLFLEYEVIELDDEIRKVLDMGSGLFEAIGRSPASKAHAAVGPGCALVSGILNFIKANVNDAVEKQAKYLVEGIREGELVEYAEDGGNKGKCLISLKVKKLGSIKVIPENLEVSCRLSNLDLNVDDSGLYERIKSWLKEISKISLRYRLKNTFNDIKNIIGTIPDKNELMLHNMAVLNFDSSVNNIHNDVTVNYRHIDDVLDWQCMELAGSVISFSQSTGNEYSDYIIPVSLDFSLNQKSVRSEDIMEIIQQGSSVLKSLNGESLPSIEIAGHSLSINEGQIQSAVGFISELSEVAISLFSFNGICRLLPYGVSMPETEERGEMFLECCREENEIYLWKRTVNQSVKVNDKSIGSISFDLEFKGKPI